MAGAWALTPRPSLLSDARPYRNIVDIMQNLLIYIAILLLIFWGIGAAVHLAGSLIHFVLVLAVVFFVLHFLRRNRSM